MGAGVCQTKGVDNALAGPHTGTVITGSDIPRERQSADVAARRRRAHRALGMTLLLALGALLVYGRCHLALERERAALERGSAALLQALAGDQASWEEVEDAFGDAARVSIWDPYGLFVLEVAAQLKSGEIALGEPRLGAVIEAVGRLDLSEAARRAEEVPDETARTWALRFVSDLRAQQNTPSTSQDP